MTDIAKRPWKEPVGWMADLRRAAFDHALKYEPHPGAPGLDMDAIHRNPRFQKLKEAA